MSTEVSTYDLMPFTCPAFEWVGQSFTHCDGCGRPYWEHTHESRSGGGPFSGRSRHVVIPRARAAVVRAKWGGGR